MTNGEKMQEVFPEGKTRKCRDGVVFESDGWCHAYDSDWWDAEYKELTTKNCESCRYYGSHHEVCKYCYECSLWTQGEPTTKNDLGVDCISRAEAVRVASGYCHPSNIAKELAKLPSVTPQEPKPMVEIDLDYVIKQKYIEREVLDKIRAQIKSNLRGVEIALEVLVENHPLRPKMEGAKDTLEDCLELIDKAESEEV